jgi:hypothetical protein
MPDPFKSDYISSSVTGTSPTDVTTVAKPPQESAAVFPVTSDLGARAFGFEPERYGLGKPKRVLIRGKIASE